MVFKTKCETCGRIIEVSEDMQNEVRDCPSCGVEYSLADQAIQYMGELSDSKLTAMSEKYSSVWYNDGQAAKTVKDALTAYFSGTMVVTKKATRIGNCVGLEYVLFEDGSNLKCIGAQTFRHGQFEWINLPDSLENIGDYAFSECRKLKSIILPRGITKVGYSSTAPSFVSSRAFSNCYALKEIIHYKGLKVKYCLVCSTKLSLFNKKCSKCGCNHIAYK